MTATETTKPVAPSASVAPVKVDRKGKQLSATVTPEFFEEVDALHWDLRISTTDLVRTAVEEFVAKHKASKEAGDKKA